MKKNFKILEHTADGKFQAYGESLEKAFENSAYAMLSLMTNDKIKEKLKKKIKIKGKNTEQLLYNFLEEILFLIDSKNFILSKIKKLKIDEKKLTLEAEFLGDNVRNSHKIRISEHPKNPVNKQRGFSDLRNYEVYGNVKAITYNSMVIKKEKSKYIIQVVVDM
jgi:SHS2 domain-containing protein